MEPTEGPQLQPQLKFEKKAANRKLTAQPGKPIKD